MPDLKKIKPRYERKNENIISVEKTKVDGKSEYSKLSRIIEKSKKIEASFKFGV